MEQATPKFLIDFYELGEKPRRYDGTDPAKVFAACLEEFKGLHERGKLSNYPSQEKIQEVFDTLNPGEHRRPNYYNAGKLAYFILKKTPFLTIYIHKP